MKRFSCKQAASYDEMRKKKAKPSTRPLHISVLQIEASLIAS